MKQLHIWHRCLTVQFKIVAHNQVYACCVSFEKNAFRQLSKVSFDVMFWHKFTTRFFVQKSIVYERNHLLYNKVNSVLKKK